MPASAARNKVRPKNVLFIAVDDMKPALGCYGDPVARTPHIDALAADGVVFRRAYCQQAVSGPTRASLLTGLRPEEVGVTELNTWMRAKNPDVVTLPQAFREAGYETRGVGKIFHGTKNSLDERSWSERPSLYEYSRNEEYQLAVNKTGKKARAVEFADVPDSLYFDVKIRNEALARLEELSRSDEPFFLAVGFLKPHLPFCAPERYRELYAGRDFALADTLRARPENAPEIACHNSEELRGYTDIPDLMPLSAEQEAELRRAYYACVSFTDDNIGAILDRLKELGLYDDTLIVLWGDHGYHLGEQDLWCKSTVYEAACRAPLVIKPTGRPRHREVEEVVEFLDVYPTVSTCAASRTVTAFRGGACGRCSTGGACANAMPSVSFSVLIRRLRALRSGVTWAMPFVTGRWTYTEWVDLTGRVAECELYDMSPGGPERRNLAGEPRFGSVERRMSRALHRVLRNQKGGDGHCGRRVREAELIRSEL